MLPLRPLCRSLTVVGVCASLSMGCAYSNKKKDIDDNPIFNTGVGATILFPGQGIPMPTGQRGGLQPGVQAPPGSAPPPQAGQPLPQGQPGYHTARPGGGAPATRGTTTGSGSGGGSGGGVTFIGGSEIEEQEHRELRQEPLWLKYLALPFAVAAYPFKKIADLARGDDGPPPPATPQAPAVQHTPAGPIDANAAFEAGELDAMERELQGRGGARPAADPVARTTPAPAPTRRRRPTRASSSIGDELAALRAGRTASAQPEMAPPPVASAPRGPAPRGVADQVADRNRDGRPDKWTYRDAGRPVRELFDEDGDGQPDRTVHYEPDTGHESRIEEDTNLDGEIDSWVDYRGGQVARHRRDTDFDGFLDTWSFYRAGQLQRQEQDLNGDGFRNRVSFYEGGRLVRERQDQDGDGRIDQLTFYDESEKVARKDEDRDGDGLVDTRSFYENGRLVRRELLTEDLRESIEEDELTSAAWSTGDEASEVR